jgi:hypothetical protein
MGLRKRKGKGDTKLYYLNGNSTKDTMIQLGPKRGELIRTNITFLRALMGLAGGGKGLYYPSGG